MANNNLNIPNITDFNGLNNIEALTISNIKPLVIIPRNMQYNENKYIPNATLFSAL